jgi:ketosteroid isomerase-like protein
MSQENVEIVQRLHAAWNRGGIQEALALIDPEIEVETKLGGLNDGSYRGHRGVFQVLEDFWSQFDDPGSDVRECNPAGEHVFTSVLFHGRGKRSGIEVEMWQWQVWTLRNGKAVRWQLFSNRDEALEAAGLSE